MRLKKLDALRFTSTAAIVCFAYVAIIVVLYAFVDGLDLCDVKNLHFPFDIDQLMIVSNAQPDDPERYESFWYCTFIQHQHSLPKILKNI